MRDSDDVTPFKIETIVIAVVVVVAAVATWGVLNLARDVGGRPAGWLLGLAFLLVAGIALFRLRKKV
jgi:hypothetical protein